MPTPMISGCSSLNIDLEGAKFWYNSYFIVTMDIVNVLNPKGGPKKSWSMLFESGVINQKFKVLIQTHCGLCCVLVHTRKCAQKHSRHVKVVWIDSVPQKSQNVTPQILCSSNGSKVYSMLVACLCTP